MIPFLLLFIGLLLIFVEFFLPGGILGAIGGLFLLAAIIVFAFLSVSVLALFFFVILTVALFIALVKFTLWRIRSGKSIYLGQDQEGYVASAFASEVIGKKGRVISDLKPSGTIEVEGKKYQALSKSGYIYKNSEVTVIGGEGGHLIVTSKENT